MHTRVREMVPAECEVAAMTARVITLKGGGAGEYYVEALPSYYLDPGEPAGLWHGHGAQLLGLHGEIDDDQFLRLMAGLDPHATGNSPLGRTYGETSVCGFDITASAPKSVSVLFAVGDDQTRNEVLAAHDTAVATMVRWVEAHAHTRFRINGDIAVVDVEGIVAYYDTTGWLTEDSGHDLFIPPLLPDEQLSSIASTGSHYCCVAAFTNKGRALGSLAGIVDLVELGIAPNLQGPVLAAEPTPSNNGAWLVASDGGIFALGDAQFAGSMGGLPLNQPVVAMAPDPDGNGYWLVASEGGIFAFNAQFRGSIPGILAPGQQLNQPVVGAVPWGNGYLMVASDGGIFSFSDAPFLGSLGHNPPNSPIIDIAAWWQSEP
ncbi:MAG: relaxase domain-containing protein [Actinomycetia bacterium]|nr:relaxase domain-containing protein [Actinomycetes bacterium]